MNNEFKYCSFNNRIKLLIEKNFFVKTYLRQTCNKELL